MRSRTLREWDNVPSLDIMGPGYVVLVRVMNSIGLRWAGYEIDRPYSRSNVDEYLLPVVMLWAELLVVTLLIFSEAWSPCARPRRLRG